MSLNLIKSGLDESREKKYAPVTLETVNLAGTFTGYASVFGEIDQGRDVVERGAFSSSLNKRGAKGIKLLFQHDPEQPIGIWEEIIEDQRGLWVKGRIISSTPRGREVLELMRAGALDGLSIGFRTQRARTDKKSGARHILAADLWEISIVTFPMLETARIETLKSAGKYQARIQPPADTIPTIREFEKWLTQDAGLTRKQARTVIRKGFCELVSKPGAARSSVTSEIGLAQTIRQATALLNT